MTRNSLSLRHSCFTVALLAASQIIFAQTPALKEKKATLSDDSKVTYHVKDQNIKEGPYYIKSAKSGQLLLKGAYTDNERSGNWYFFNEAGKPEIVYSFQQSKLAFIDSALLNKLIINIPGDDQKVAEHAKIPVLLSPIKLFLAEMANNITIPEEHFMPGEPLKIQIKSEIDVTGEAKYAVSYQNNGKIIEHQLKLKKSAFDIAWIPAIYESNPVKSEVIINTEINTLSNSEDGQRRFRWN